jgi:hypothetical protein
MSAPRTWTLPPEPGPEVTAVRSHVVGSVYRRTPSGLWRAAGVLSFSWAEILAFAPLTDASGEPS